MSGQKEIKSSWTTGFYFQYLFCTNDLSQCMSYMSQYNLALGRAQDVLGSRMLLYLVQDICFSDVRILGATFCRFYCED